MRTYKDYILDSIAVNVNGVPSIQTQTDTIFFSHSALNKNENEFQTNRVSDTKFYQLCVIPT